MYLSVYDNRDGVSECTASPSVPSSITHVHRCIGSHNVTRQMMTTSTKLTYLSVYDIRDDVSERVASPFPPPRSHMYTVIELIFVRVQCFTNFATKAFCTLRNNNWIQLLYNFDTKAFCTFRNLFRTVQNAIVAKLVKHCALTEVIGSPSR
jgi:hypothetical protein